MATLDHPELRESLNTLLKTSRPRLERVLRNFEIPPEDAEDILQDVFGILRRDLEIPQDPLQTRPGGLEESVQRFPQFRMVKSCHSHVVCRRQPLG